MTHGTGRRRAFVALGLLLAVALLAPVAAAGHDHPEQFGSECRICETSTAQSVAVPGGVALPAPSAVAGQPGGDYEHPAPPPVPESRAARAPPA